MDPRRRRIDVRAQAEYVPTPTAAPVPTPTPAVAPDIADVYRKRHPWAALLAGVAIGMAGVFLAWRAVAPSDDAADAPSAADTTAVATEPEIVERIPLEKAERMPSAARPEPARAEIASEDRRTVRPTSASIAAETSRPSLPARSAREIERAFDVDRSAYGGCFQAGLANDASIEGIVFVRFHVGSDGAVSGVRVARSTLRSAVVENCLVQVMSRWRFSPGRKAETFELEFPFARD